MGGEGIQLRFVAYVPRPLVMRVLVPRGEVRHV
eukprot:SAG31_NODE_10203_length_1171_cov_1.309701_1_plen_32_part_10